MKNKLSKLIIALDYETPPLKLNEEVQHYQTSLKIAVVNLLIYFIRHAMVLVDIYKINI